MQAETAVVRLRQFWGQTKRADLLASLNESDPGKEYVRAQPNKANRLSFKPQQASVDYLSWPRLTDLSGHEPIYGLNENRRGAMISIDRKALVDRMTAYC